ncbi:protein disabled isoform X2 [Leptidea sinapis]|uniref:protein disabled isoform X2 n=1 Tax=Leptidea sinapis TaxID=189913 RepID=UPI0021C38348|nr:protein disabled isoform X2 [Leptidea sinapis]
MFNHKLPTDFPMQTLRKKTSPCKFFYAPLADKNDPGRFLGEGVSFRAKLIGVLEVPEARGDRMCQEALSDLKMAIRAAGEHKQRIQVHVAIDGLRLRDDKTGDSLYHHPVHKISFIAQDMIDSRAFGYIFGSPDTGHRFFGIKTDKAASQVVIAMRDLFQVVFELKKKEIEMAKQQLEGKTLTSSLLRHPPSTIIETKSKSVTAGESSLSKPGDGEGVVELVDLEQELCSLRRGLTQVEGLTPSDPFGDSFTTPLSKGLLPPPPGTIRAGRSPNRTSSSPSKPSLPFDLTSVASDFEAQPATVETNTNSEATELKNPPKKVLKDLVPNPVTEPPGPTESVDSYGPTTTMTSLTRHSGGSVSIAKSSQSTAPFAGFFTSDPFAETDPFDNTDPFSDTFKDDPFTSMQEYPKSSFLRSDDLKARIQEKSTTDLQELKLDSGKNVFNGPLQVSLPPEPVPKSPRLQRQLTDTNTIRQRPLPISKLQPDNASPPPPLPPKKVGDMGLPPPRPPHDTDTEDPEMGPPLPKPVRKKEPLLDRSIKPRMSSITTTSSEEEYLAPAPPPLPAARRFDITLSQLLTLTTDQLASRLRVPTSTLSSMTLPQLTEYLRSYLSADVERSHIHVEPKVQKNLEKYSSLSVNSVRENTDKVEKPAPQTAEVKSQFEDNFAPSDSAETFVANFDDFDKKVNSTYDKYAAFREIQEQELKAKSILDPTETEPAEVITDELIKTDEKYAKESDKSPLKSLDELTLDTFNMFRNSTSPKPVEEKIEDIKTVMKNLQIEKSRRSVSPKDNGLEKHDETDRYAALREITITEPQDEFESLPEVPKERKKSDEKSDGFDNSDFFDCIDSSLTFTHVEDAFRKSPLVKEREEKKMEVKKETVVEVIPASLQPPARLSAGSISDVASGSSPDAKDRCGAVAGGGSVTAGGLRRLNWTEGWSSDSRDSEPRSRRRRPPRGHTVETSSSSRDASPWEEEPPRHGVRRDRDSRQNSSGSRECLDSGSGREKDKREKREPSRERERREVSRERRHDVSRERAYGREYRRDRGKEYREIERRRGRHLYDDDDYSDGCGSGRSSPREQRWSESRWRRDDRNYGSLGWRETRRRHEIRQTEDSDRRYGSTLNWPRRAGSRHLERDLRDSREQHRDSGRDSREHRDSGRDSREPRDSGRDSGRESRDPRDSGRDSGRDSRDPRDSGRDSGRDNKDRRRRREPTRRDYRFSNDFSPREKEHSPFDNDYQETPAVAKKRAPYSSLEGTRFAFEEDTTASPLSSSSVRRDGDSPATRFRFDSDTMSPRSLFEDDFIHTHPPRPRTASIAEEEEGDIPPLRTKPPVHKDIKKSDSVNIFTRESDPFENDSFFACTGTDRVAKRENWPGDFVAFEDI